MAIPLLTASLRDKDGNVRLAAVEALGTYGAKAKVAVPLILKVLRDGDIHVGGWGWSIHEALKRIDPEAARKAAE